MERVLEYTITSKDHNKTIGQFLKEHSYSAQTIVELKKMPESILLNNVWEYVTRKLSLGDKLTIHINETECSEKIPPVEMALHIVYEDEDIIVINKPFHMPVHPSMDNYYNTMANGLAWYFQSQNKPFIFRCVNRLDKDTSGLTIVAKHMLSASILSSMIANKSDESNSIQREYLALISGTPEAKAGTIDAPIARKDSSVIERCVDFTHGDRAITHYKVLEEKNGYSLLSIRLETGRTHQIRVHMKHIGHPLVGDSLYNPNPGPLSRQALHSYRLTFPHPITGERMQFTAPLPKDMEDLLLI